MKPARPFTPAAVAAVLTLGFVCTMSGQGQGTLPPSDLAKLVALETKAIDADLAKASFTKKSQKHVKLAAFMIARYAQCAKDNAPAMATLRDQALKLMKAAEAGNLEDAKKLAATLSAEIKADAAAKTGPMAMEKVLDMESVMALFNPEKSSGLNLEKDLEDLVESKGMGLDAAKLEKAALLRLKGKPGRAGYTVHSPKTPTRCRQQKWIGHRRGHEQGSQRLDRRGSRGQDRRRRQDRQEHQRHLHEMSRQLSLIV